MLDIVEKQEEFNSYYGKGIEALTHDDFIKARKNLSIAVDKMLEIAKGCTGTLQAQKIKKAEDVLMLLNKVNASIKRAGSPANKKLEGVDATDEVTKFKPVDKTDVYLDDVAGLEEVKEEVRKKIIFPMKYPEIYKRFKKTKGGGILLYGVPGTGKTMIAKAIANEIDAKFYSIKCSDIASRWFGDSEQNIKELFNEARKYPYSIIFFDEFESLGGKRTEFSSNAIKMVVQEILAQMNGFEESDNTLLCIAATNRPWDIDSAFLRPGRFNTQIHVTLPDKDARRTIILNELEDIPQVKDLEIETIVDITNGFNGADVVEFCDNLKDLAIDRSIEEGRECPITNEDILTTRSLVFSSVRTKDLERIDKYCEDYQSY